MSAMAGKQATISSAASSDLQRLEPLWWALYRHQGEHGMRLKLEQDAFSAWVDSLEPFLGRFAHVTIATLGSEIVGFIAARIRTLPPYFGRGQVGVITEVFVADEHRSLGIGRRMLDHTRAWYQENAVRRIELQVVAENPDGLRFYESLGWHRELIQLVWDS
jgi:GNAT superfamily N-acetyltransferase